MITYSIETNKITVIGEGAGNPGGDADHAYGFTDIYNADVAGGWGVVARQCTNQFCFAAKIVVGDGSIATWFADTEKQITVSIFFTGIYTDHFIEIKPNATATFGKLISETSKTSEKGCSFINLNTSVGANIIKLNGNNVNLYLYSCWLKNVGDGTSGKIYYSVRNDANIGNVVRIWDTIIDGGFLTEPNDCYRITLKRTSHGIYNLKGNISASLVHDNYMGVVVYNPPVRLTLRNLTLRNNDYSIRACRLINDTFFIDCDIDVWNILWECSGNTHKFYRQYTFNLKVIEKDGNNINGASVKIWDKDSNLVVDTTTASGAITEQTISRGYYNQANGNTLQEVSPHTIQISRAGYQTYKTEFTLDKKTDWVIRLKRISINIDSEVIA